ncbi:hypothetical protein MMC15_002556 [Xylographa vitiligo]|nr:hypothetical protein [Xylographa vitiligo]
MITEIVTFQLKGEATLPDSSSPARKVIRDFLTLVLAALGARSAYYGQFIEKPEIVIMFIGWDSIDDHKSFMNSPNYETHINNLRTIINNDKPLTILHVPFNPSDNPAPALGANSNVGVTEVVYFYFPSALTSGEKDVIMSSVDKMRPVMERSEVLAVYDGWAVEEAVPNPGPQASEGEKSKVYINVCGWVDVEAHMRFTGTEDFGQNIHHLLGLKNISDKLGSAHRYHGLATSEIMIPLSVALGTLWLDIAEDDTHGIKRVARRPGAQI